MNPTHLACLNGIILHYLLIFKEIFPFLAPLYAVLMGFAIKDFVKTGYNPIN